LKINELNNGVAVSIVIQLIFTVYSWLNLPKLLQKLLIKWVKRKVFIN